MSNETSRQVPRWRKIRTARLTDRILGMDGRTGEEHETWWGKASHIGWYGWCWGDDPEDISAWSPTHWKPLPEAA